MRYIGLFRKYYKKCEFCGFYMFRGYGMHYLGPGAGVNKCKGSFRYHDGPKKLTKYRKALLRGEKI